MMPALVATRTSVEVLRFLSESARAGVIFKALQAAAGGDFEVQTSTETYRGGSDLLLLWGPGSKDRFEPMRRQLGAGGHVCCLDLAYWDRDRKFRVSIDAAHPQAWVMKRDWPCDRFVRDRVHVAETWKEDGPIIIAGIGRKARVQYGTDTDPVFAWETSMIAACQARWPKRRIWYRRKQLDAPTPPHVNSIGGPIDKALTGASLVITWHSNVAVDAIRMGIPVVCRDGAAAAVCPSELPEHPQPLPRELRDAFLGNLAWFQWDPREAAACWAFLQELLS